jgi:hypothetical protein
VAGPVNAQSTAQNLPGVYGENNKGGDGVFGRGTDVGRGVVGVSDEATGTEGNSTSGSGVFGSSVTGEGVHGISHSPSGAAAVIGINDGSGPGIRGVAAGFDGVSGTSTSGFHAGVGGSNESQTGGIGVQGESFAGPGVRGHSTRQAGVVGESAQFDGVYGIAYGAKSAVTGFNPNGTAGFFDGNVHVTHDVFVKGDIQLEGNDLAERFWLVGESVAEPGEVVVLAGDDRVRVSDEPYDHRVAGVVSGASAYRPGLVLGGRDEPGRSAVALAGKVWCRVDADYGAIGLGDLLTTSGTLGHAMRAADPARAFGAVVGKALGSLEQGRGLLPILVALQ